MTLNSGIQTYQILTNDDEVCIPSLSSILLAVRKIYLKYFGSLASLASRCRFTKKFQNYCASANVPETEIEKCNEKFSVKTPYDTY